MKVPWSDHPWRRVLVYGLGVSGCAASAFLRRRGVAVVAVDGRTPEVLDLGALVADAGVELRLGPASEEELPASIDGVVVSPGVTTDRPLLRQARSRGIPVVAEVELAFPFLSGPVVGITGSNGKSTTTALTGWLLAAAGLPVEVCGNIGRPLTACVDGPRGRTFVVELSSFQLEGVITFRPRAAALLNLVPDHLDRHGTVEAYAAAKAALFARQEVGEVAVLNGDDPAVAALPVPGRRRLFSRRSAVADGCFLDGGQVVEAAPDLSVRFLFGADDVPLAGAHNLENAMAAALLALAVGAPPSALPGALRRFRGLPHRIEEVAEVAGVRWVDDSKGTNLTSTARALESQADGTVHLILGGRHKGGSLAPLVPWIERKARAVYLIGEAAESFGRQLAGRVAWVDCGGMERAVAAAAAAARSGDVVLLSPACASFDQYRDYAERGAHFKRLVGVLVEGKDGQEARR